MIRKVLNDILQSKNAIMFITALVFMLGILGYFHDNATITSAIISIILIVAVVKNFLSTRLVLFWLFMFYFGFFLTLAKTPSTDDLVKFAPNKVVIEAQIVSIPSNNKEFKSKFFAEVFKVGAKKVKGKTVVTLTDYDDDFSDLKIGDSYRFSGKLTTPFVSTNPSQFDYAKYLQNFDTFTTFYAKKNDIEKIDIELSNKWRFLQILNDVRYKIISTHSKYIKSPNLEVLGGIVFGDDAISPSEGIKKSFANSGLLHILAASGMNVAFIYGFWYFLLRRLKAPFKFTVISGMCLVIIYTLMTGLGPSIIRAALMLLIILFGKLIDKDTHSISLLAFVAMLMLIYNPAYINNVGFQLSFTVTFGLILTGGAIFEKIKELKIPHWLSASILIPIIAQIWVAPIQMFYFNTFCVYSIIANILSVPFLSIISFGGFISSIFAIFMPHSHYICLAMDYILNIFITIIISISDFFANMSNSIITTTHPSIIQVFAFYLITLCATFLINNDYLKNFRKKLLIFTSIIFVILLLSTININHNKLEIIAFDVQNADCFLIKTPNSKYFMIDTGKAGYANYSQARSISLKYLKDRGIKNLKGLVITHFDIDHAGGAVDILNELKVENIYLNYLQNTSNAATKIYDYVDNHKINSSIVQNDFTIYSEKDFAIKTYYADFSQQDFNHVSDFENENSILNLVKYKDFEMLFMGDGSVLAFDRVKDLLPRNVEVLKVGHHGGYNVVNENMLEHLNNSISLISTGNNRYGHPYLSTIENLENTEIYRTDKNHSIKIISNGEKYSISTFDTNQKKFINYKQFDAKN
ncbi:MAG: DNA internalization-related competence protein ComEC/Rec2 [Candidatus Gastranaerophilales bacterium]